MSTHVEFQIMIDFKGSHYPKDVVLYAVSFYVRYAVSYRDLEEILAERGVAFDRTPQAGAFACTVRTWKSSLKWSAPERL